MKKSKIEKKNVRKGEGERRAGKNYKQKGEREKM